MKAMRLPQGRCFQCNKRLDGVEAYNGDELPSAGDLSICWHCGHVMAYEADLSLRELTAEEQAVAAANADVQGALDVWRQSMKGSQQ